MQQNKKRYALDFSLGSTRALVEYYGKYAIGTGDFTAEAWVCTNKGGTVMSTDQVQEPYNRFIGKIGEIRFWNSSKTYEDSGE